MPVILFVSISKTCKFDKLPIMFGIVPRKLCGPSSEKCVSSDNAAISLGILPSRLLSSKLILLTIPSKKLLQRIPYQVHREDPLKKRSSKVPGQGFCTGAFGSLHVFQFSPFVEK